MAIRSKKTDGTRNYAGDKPAVLPDDFPAELLGDFAEISSQFWSNYGVVAGLCLARGGYIGLSITDDNGSAKLAIRCPSLSFEKRCYKLGDLEKLLLYARNKLGS